MTPSKMPEWPQFAPRSRNLHQDVAEYQTALAAAWEARARRMHGALLAVQAESRSLDAMWFEQAYDKIVTEALDAIGPLPELPAPPPLAEKGG